MIEVMDNEYWGGIKRYVRSAGWRPTEQVQSPIIDFLTFRDSWVKPYSWTATAPRTVEFVRSFCPRRVLDPLAGTGWWAYLLRRFGVKVVATDLNPPAHGLADNIWHPDVDTHVPVQPMDAVKAMLISKPSDTLLLSWPPSGDLAARVLQAFRGDWLVYIGEHGGTDADKAFFDELPRGFRATDMHLPVRFECMNDAISVWRRKHAE